MMKHAHILQALIKRVFSRAITEFKRINNYSSEDKKYWDDLKGKYKGKRGFVIGNGPSLTAEDLSLISDEVTIASNKIYLIFDKTNWRPTIFTVADRLLWLKINKKLDSYFSDIHIPDYLNSNGVRNCHYWKSPFTLGKKKFSKDLSKGAYGGHTVTYENIQIAAHLGLNPIYLIGCDHNYKGEKNSGPGVAIKQGSEQTHFIKGYRKEGELVLPASIKKMEESYHCAKKTLEENDISIFNATRGGNLEIFKRTNFDDLMDE